MLPFPFAMHRPDVTPGSVSFTTVGTFQFTVPEHNTLTVVVRGGGGGGTGRTHGAGQSSSFGDITATGGGTYNEPGTGINGDQNYTGGLGGTSGGVGDGGPGGAGAYGGGAGGVGVSKPGSAPGGGGSGANIYFAPLPGGAGGGCAVKVYNEGLLTPGAQVTVVVGAGGTIVMGGGDGARGQVDISWN